MYFIHNNKSTDDREMTEWMRDDVIWGMFYLLLSTTTTTNIIPYTHAHRQAYKVWVYYDVARWSIL